MSTQGSPFTIRHTQGDPVASVTVGQAAVIPCGLTSSRSPPRLLSAQTPIQTSYQLTSTAKSLSSSVTRPTSSTYPLSCSPSQKITVEQHHIDETRLVTRRSARDQIHLSWNYRCAYCDDPLGRSPTLDHVVPKVHGGLTVRENLRHHGHLYGLGGSELDVCMDASMRRLAIRDRADDIVEQLSGGLQRRVELAKGLVTRPRLLILDEPATGLDPGARIDLWRHLSTLRSEDGVTILVTTHLMDEAEHCDRLAILDNGRIVAIGTPSELKRKIGGDIITIETPEPEKLSSLIAERFGTVPTHLGETLLLEQADGHVMVGQLVEAFSERISSISLGKPTLEDVFIHETGHRFWEDA
ncbi:MAG: ATP-binding cassette domain-containing protein [Myxococcales bacterium]|nr:MAG: ATP-binding cassette domain-containing protein [Myxococcales bacterium]